MTRGRLPALGALLAMAAIVIGVPVLLVALVGNPWPGWTQLELRDDAAVLVGVLACLAWLVWLRFVIAVVVEVRAQLAELREIGSTVAPALMPVSAAPARRGTGIVAQRLVAAALVLLPMATRVSHAVADDGLGGGDARGAATAPASPAAPAAPAPTPAAPAATATRAVTVVPGDTLFGLARSQLGDSARWREIYDLNRERPQRDGGRLTSPSMIRAGWRLLVPADVAPASAPASGGLDRPAAAPAPDVAAAAFTVSSGDTLWALARDRLRGAGLPDDDVAVADYVHAIVENNHDIIEDPNLIFAGDRLDLPAIGRAAAPEPPPVPAPPSPPLAVAMEPPVPMAAPAPDSAEPAAPPATIAEVATPVAPTPTTTSAPPAAPVGGGPVGATSTVPGSPAPIGIGEAALLSAGVLALVASRRRTRLRASRPRARVPEPPGGSVVTERRLRAVDASERLLRVDVAIRAAAASLVEGTAQVAVVCAGVDGGIDLTLTAVATLPGPWEGEGLTWSLPGSTPIELLVDAARTVGAPCVALAQLGVASDGRDVLADLEALGVLAIDAPEDLADSVVRGLAATLASSVFAEVANLVGAGIDEGAFLEHRHAHRATTVDGALELAATLVGTTSAARQSTFALRARHTSGEAWEPAVVLVGSSLLGEATADLVSSAARRRGGLALVVGGPLAEAPWSLRATDRRWVLDPVGIELVPVGLSVGELGALHHVLEAADAPLLDDEPVVADLEAAPGVDDLAEDEPWSLMVRLLGQVEVVDAGGASAGFERSKALELIAWLTLHRDRATRAGARTALWELDVRDATFANVVSEARRAMARLVDPPPGEEWLGRTLTEVLPLHAGVVADVDIVRRRLTAARLQPPELAIETLRPAVELIHDMPFAGTGYLWPDAEGITSNLVLLATSASTELAGHFLSMGDIDGVFWATGQGLRVLPGHEELIALRMRAHARAGDLSGVRLEWESYERVLDADPWSDGEPAPKLVLLRRELLSS